VNSIACRLRQNEIVLLGHDQSHAVGLVAYRCRKANDRFIYLVPVVRIGDEWRDAQIGPELQVEHTRAVTQLVIQPSRHLLCTTPETDAMLQSI